jgi:hypothetical protein
MFKRKVFVLLVFGFLSIVFADTIPGGDVSGTWYLYHSPYYITGNITVQSGDTLNIEPGVDVIFLGFYRLHIAGQLIAEGTASDSIRFVPQDTVVGWRGLYYALRSSQRLSYCHIEYAHESGIWLNSVLIGLHISHSTITLCRSDYGAGIRVQGIADTLDISHSNITYNKAETDSGGKGGGIYLYFGSLIMDSCIVHANRAIIPNEDYYHAVQGGGIYLGMNSVDVVIANSSITDNFIGLSNGGRSQGVYPPDRGGGIFNGSQEPVFISNCLISGNRANVDFRSGGGIGSDEYSSLTTLSHCNISNNWTPIYAGGFETARNADIINCTFSGNNYYAILCGLGGTVCNILNTIVAYNRSGINHSVGTCTLNISYSDIMDNCQGMPAGFGVLDTVNYNQDSCDMYFNIFMDPMFEDTANHNYHLTAGSPCIDAGDPASPYDPDTTIADIGAYWYNPVRIDKGPVKTSFQITGYTGATIFKGALVLPKDKTCRVFDITGRTVKPAQMKPGVYFLQLGTNLHKVLVVR